jgi:N-glycosylase/DNA lyase
MPEVFHQTFPAPDFDLDATLSSGQAFRWKKVPTGWTGVIGNRWVGLKMEKSTIKAQTVELPGDWKWLKNYLQLEVELAEIIRSFPDHPAMDAAVLNCRGLRLLRQDPWECLASFILSSTKQIVQIQQIIVLLTERYGAPLAVPDGCPQIYSFPSPKRIATLTEQELRACKMGFRAPYLLATAHRITTDFDLTRVGNVDLTTAREMLLSLPGVGRKIADCVLLFAFGFQESFPIDVWLLKALRQLFFPRRRVPMSRLHGLVEAQFGPHAGFAQQYLFHYVRMRPSALPNLRPRKTKSLPRRTKSQKTREPLWKLTDHGNQNTQP